MGDQRSGVDPPRRHQAEGSPVLALAVPGGITGGPAQGDLLLVGLAVGDGDVALEGAEDGDHAAARGGGHGLAERLAGAPHGFEDYIRALATGELADRLAEVRGP